MNYKSLKMFSQFDFFNSKTSYDCYEEELNFIYNNLDKKVKIYKKKFNF